MAEDRFSNLDIDPLNIILCKFDLPELTCMKLINRRFNNHISSLGFAAVYCQRNSACLTWAITHSFTEFDQLYGFLRFQRMLDNRVFTFHLQEYFQGLSDINNELSLLSTSGSLCLFKIQTHLGNVRLYIVNVFAGTIEVLPDFPDGLVFDNMNYVKMIEANLNYTIHCARYIMGEMQYLQYNSEDGEWGHLGLGVRARPSDLLVTDDPRNIVMVINEFTYLVSFPYVAAFPVFKEVDTGDMLDFQLLLPFLGEPSIVPLWSTVAAEYHSTGDGFIAIIVKNINHPLHPDVCVMRQVVLFRIRDDWSNYDLVSIFPVDGLPHEQFRLVGGHALENINGKVNFALSINGDFGFGYMLFSYDLDTGLWENFRIPLDGQFSAVKPMFTSCLTIRPIIP